MVYGDLGELSDIDSIQEGLKWLDENVAVCLDIVQSLSLGKSDYHDKNYNSINVVKQFAFNFFTTLDSTGPCADCTIQLRLPNGTKTIGGFHR